MHPYRHQAGALPPAGAQATTVDGVSPEQPEEGSRQQDKRASKRKQKKSAAEESSQPPAPGRRMGNLPGGIFSEHTLAGLADGVPSHPSTASQLPFNAAGDLPDNLPAEPLMFWPPSNQDAPSDAEQPAQVRLITPLQHCRMLVKGPSALDVQLLAEQMGRVSGCSEFVDRSTNACARAGLGSTRTAGGLSAVAAGVLAWQWQLLGCSPWRWLCRGWCRLLHREAICRALCTRGHLRSSWAQQQCVKIMLLAITPIRNALNHTACRQGRGRYG